MSKEVFPFRSSYGPALSVFNLGTHSLPLFSEGGCMVRSVHHPFSGKYKRDPRKRRSDRQAWASHSSYPNPNQIGVPP